MVRFVRCFNGNVVGNTVWVRFVSVLFRRSSVRHFDSFCLFLCSIVDFAFSLSLCRDINVVGITTMRSNESTWIHGSNGPSVCACICLAVCVAHLSLKSCSCDIPFCLCSCDIPFCLCSYMTFRSVFAVTFCRSRLARLSNALKNDCRISQIVYRISKPLTLKPQA